jgi:hypothetical protein
VEAMLRQVLKRFAVKQLILVADRGLLTLETLAELARVGAETGVRVDFVMALSARRHAAMKQVNRTLVFQQGLAEGRFADRRLIVAHDETRATEQRAAREARMAAAEVVGERLAQKLDRQDAGENEPGRKATDRGAYARFKHELRERRLSHLYRIDWTAAQFTFDRDDDALAAAEAFDGRLYLLTSLDQKDYPAAAVVERYKTLADIERGFRVLKSELLIAPMHHRLETRIRAHALICFLALLLHRVMRKRLKQRGSTTSPATALRVLEQVQQHQVRVGGATWAGLSRQSTEHHTLFAQLDIPAPV